MAIGLALSLTACVDPPGDGNILLNIDRIAVRPDVGAIKFTVEQVSVFYDAPPPIPQKNDSCEWPTGIIATSVPKSEVQIDLTSTGIVPLGNIATKPGRVTEIRLLVLGLQVLKGGQWEEATTIERCKVDPWGQRKDAPGASAQGAEHGRPRMLLRFVPKPGTTLDLAADVTLIVKAPFDPNVDVVAGEVDELEHPVDHRVAERDEGIDGADGSDLKVTSRFELEIIPPTEFGVLPGVLLVSFRPGTTDAEIATIGTNAGVIMQSGFANFRRCRFGSGDSLAALNRLRSDARVLSALPETLVHTTAVPNDLPSQVWWTGSDRINAQGAWDVQTGSRQAILAVLDTGLDLTHPDLVNNIFLNEGELPPAFTQLIGGVKAADFDGDGIITFHDFNPEDPTLTATARAFLSAQGVTNRTPNQFIDCPDLLTVGNGVVDQQDNDGNGFADDLCGWNFVPTTDSAGNSTGLPGTNQTQDDNGHGTFVTGMAAAVGNNGIGIPGIAWAVRILPVKVATATGVTQGRGVAIQGMQYAQSLGASVANYSSNVSISKKNATIPSSPNNCKLITRMTSDEAFTSAIASVKTEWNSASPAITIPFSTAADDCPLNYDSAQFFSWPAGLRLPNAIVTTATDRNDAIPAFAGFGATVVDIGSPGDDMWGPMVGGGTGQFLVPGSTISSGTSYAAPITAATMVLIGLQRPALAGNGAALRQRIVDTADKTGIKTAGGRINVSNALTAP